MKRVVFLLLAWVSVATVAQAQSSPFVNALAVGTGLLLRASDDDHSPREQEETLYVTPATYQTSSFPQKRTPSKKMPKPGKGRMEVVALEEYLNGRYAAFRADTTALLLTPDDEKGFNRLRTSLEAVNPLWNASPYADELSFYRQHDNLRRRLAQVGVSR